MRILVVEDERKIASFVQKGLKECGFAVDVIHRGSDIANKYAENISGKFYVDDRT